MTEMKEGKGVEREDKTSLVFEGEALEALREIARREHKRLDEVIEDALSLKKWSLRVKDEGGRVIVRKGKRDEYELVI